RLLHKRVSVCDRGQPTHARGLRERRRPGRRTRRLGVLQPPGAHFIGRPRRPAVLARPPCSADTGAEEVDVEGVRILALGGVPGAAYSPPASTELGGPEPVAD